MKQVCKVGGKTCERIFGVKELSQVQKSSPSTLKVKPDSFM